MIEYIERLGYKNIRASHTEQIALWKSWYKGKIEKFHTYEIYNGKKHVKCERASLCMAKKVCEDWANLLLNEKVTISTSDDASTKLINEILSRNNFRVRANQLIETAFALGTGAFVEYLNGDDIGIDYIRADMIFPISYDMRGVTECAFASEKVINDKKYAYIQLHVLENGFYVVKNRLFDMETGEQVPPPADVKEDYSTHRKEPLFQIITPNIVNSYNFASPMGMSVFANAIDILKGIDLVYDSYCNEYRLGKKRIIVPQTMAQAYSDETGTKPMFDERDTVFYGLNSGNDEMSITSIDPSIRSAEHKEGLQEQLNLFSDSCGLGTDRYSFENQGVKTATEVISEKSELFQNLQKHEIILNHALTGMARAVLFLGGKDENIDIKIDFDDSIIHDTDTEFNQNMQLVSAGIMPAWEFRTWWFNESEQQAKQMISSEFEGAPEE